MSFALSPSCCCLISASHSVSSSSEDAFRSNILSPVPSNNLTIREEPMINSAALKVRLCKGKDRKANQAKRVMRRYPLQRPGRSHQERRNPTLSDRIHGTCRFGSSALWWGEYRWTTTSPACWISWGRNSVASPNLPPSLICAHRVCLRVSMTFPSCWKDWSPWVAIFFVLAIKLTEEEGGGGESYLRDDKVLLQLLNLVHVVRNQLTCIYVLIDFSHPVKKLFKLRLFGLR